MGRNSLCRPFRALYFRLNYPGLQLLRSFALAFAISLSALDFPKASFAHAQFIFCSGRAAQSVAFCFDIV
jgi:hypothetical protein